MNIKKITLLVLIFLPLCLLSPQAVSAETRAKTYTVNSDTNVADANPGDGVCATPGGNCTLHAAIEEANKDGQSSLIKFASRFQLSLGTQINDDTLPALTESFTIIDGSDRWDNANNRPGVEVSCTICDNIIQIQSNGNVIRGIMFAGAEYSGIYLFNGNDNMIGGTNAADRNVFITGKYGVWLASGLSNSVINNYFGTITGEDVPGMIAGDYGIYAIADSNTIEDNLIVGYTGISSMMNPAAGIFLSYSDDNSIVNNVIGMDKYETSTLGNEVGIYAAWSDNNIIGPDNIIDGNTSHGVEIYQSKDTTISKNKIGGSFNTGNGGDGIHLHAVSNETLIKDNSIGNNNGNCVWLDFYKATIFGNGIGNNKKDGIYINDISHYGSNTIIGGSGAGERNGIGSNGENGIHLSGVKLTTIQNNYIGVRSEGAFDSGNKGHGIFVENGSDNNTIGGNSVSGEGNRIDYNDQDGIRIEGATTHHNFVYGNIIGAPINWAWEAGNDHHGIGIYDGAHHNFIGTSNTSLANVIVSSGWSGVVIKDGGGNIVEGNHIGTDGIHGDWGNAYYGVVVTGNGNENIVSFNEIAYNGTHNGLDGGQAGVYIESSDGNMISRNSIYTNDGPGILLVSGGNNNFSAPIIIGGSCEGTISGTAPASSWVQIFSDNASEGRVWEGTTRANSSGQWSWPGIVIGPNLTATARSDSTSDTSAFSAPFTVGFCMINTYLPIIQK